MVIDKNELITENQNVQEVKSQILNTKESLKNEDFDLTSKKYNKSSNNNNTNSYDDNIDGSSIIELASDDSTPENLIANTSQEENSFLATDDPKNEMETTAEKETVETNCLALTVRKDYNLSIVKNSILTTFRISWKVALSTFILNVLKLFF